MLINQAYQREEINVCVAQYMPALTATSYNSLTKDLDEQLLQKGKPNYHEITFCVPRQNYT